MEFYSKTSMQKFKPSARMTVSSRCGSEVGSCRVDHRCATTPRLPRIRQGYLRKPCISDTPEIRSLRLVLAEKQTSYQTVLSDTPEIRSLKPRLDRGEARALLFSKECQSLWLYLPVNNHHASIPAQGIALLHMNVQMSLEYICSYE